MTLEYQSIWDKYECILPNGQPCLLCCFASNIPQIPKKELTLCLNQTKYGCGIENSKPDTCRDFECGDPNNPNYIVDFLIDAAEQYNFVTSQEANKARIRLGLI